MAESEYEDEDNEEISFLDLLKNLKTLSQKELRALGNVLIKYACVNNEATAPNDDLEAGELVKLQSTPGKGPGEKVGTSNQAEQDNAVEMNPSGQKSDLILNIPVSSNPPPSPTHARATKSPNPKRLVITSEVLSAQDPYLTEDCAASSERLIVSPPPPPTDSIIPKFIKAEARVTTTEGSDLSGEVLFDGDLSVAKEGVSNILENETVIIEGFMKALATGESGSGMLKLQGEKEFGTTLFSPKWDGTSTLSVPEVVASPFPEIKTSPLAWYSR
ncbi:hypothetical protein HAX54_036212 [Datura stramonium]|uniref:Uncharacterized protein n=1 Tax=Datura stramonium TaxID=4076 RepID=A0ABS8VJU3_DATST|nr:hypothetical protein [Datura stramonium]